MSNINNVEKLANLFQVCEWEGFWFARGSLEEATRLQSGSTFQARDDDVFLTSHPKTGTGWLKSITLSIFNKHDHDHDIFTTDSPYSLVPTIASSFKQKKALPLDPYDVAPSGPRLLHVHVPYSLLPDSVKNSECKIVYITRNPKDTLISLWHFINSISVQFPEPFSVEQVVDAFCCGVHYFGSFFDHVAEYWEESKKRPEKILFVKYEELKSDTKGQISRIAEFLGKPFANEEEVEEVVGRRSLERLKNLEVNKNGLYLPRVPNSVFFRKGEVGDWKNYLTPEMEARIDEISRVKLEPLGLFL